MPAAFVHGAVCILGPPLLPQLVAVPWGSPRVQQGCQPGESIQTTSKRPGALPQRNNASEKQQRSDAGTVWPPEPVLDCVVQQLDTNELHFVKHAILMEVQVLGLCRKLVLHNLGASNLVGTGVRGPKRSSEYVCPSVLSRVADPARSGHQRSRVGDGKEHAWQCHRTRVGQALSQETPAVPTTSTCPTTHRRRDRQRPGNPIPSRSSGH